RLRTRGRTVEAVERRVEDEVLPCRLPLVEAGLLGEDADLRADLPVLAAEAEPRDLRATRRRRDERAQQAQRRRLARAVRSEVAEDLALAHLEVDAVDRGERAESLGQLLGAEDRLHDAIESMCRARLRVRGLVRRSRSL